MQYQQCYYSLNLLYHLSLPKRSQTEKLRHTQDSEIDLQLHNDHRFGFQQKPIIYN